MYINLSFLLSFCVWYIICLILIDIFFFFFFFFSLFFTLFPPSFTFSYFITSQNKLLSPSTLQQQQVRIEGTPSEVDKRYTNVSVCLSSSSLSASSSLPFVVYLSMICLFGRCSFVFASSPPPLTLFLQSCFTLSLSTNSSRSSLPHDLYF